MENENRPHLVPSRLQPGFFFGASLRLSLLVSLFVLFGGMFLVWWAASWTESEMRAELSQQTRMVAQALSLNNIRTLQGSVNDLESAAYLQLKQQLIAVRAANPQCRFIYLLGRRAGGSVYFLVDSEISSSPDYSPPGQLYDEAPPSYGRIFDTRQGLVEGPYTDRWGTWITGLEPLLDPQSGRVVAVLAADVGAQSWNWELALRAALPVGLLLVLLIGVAAALISSKRSATSPMLLTRRLMPPMAMIVILLLVGMSILLFEQQRKDQLKDSAYQKSEVYNGLNTILSQQTLGLVAAGQLIADSSDLKRALKNGEVGALEAWQPVFASLSRETAITHFAFFDARRVCLKRLQDPTRYGDEITRYTALKAERTKKAASGLEIGTFGSFTLRSVTPVFEGDTLLGYVELAKEIEEILQVLRGGSNKHLTVLIRKDFLDRASFESEMRRLGRPSEWNRLSESAVTYSSFGRLPDAFTDWAERFGGHLHPQDPEQGIAFNGKDWQASDLPLQDASGNEVGTLLIMRDITAENASFKRLLALVGGAGGVLLILLLVFIYALLSRADAGIRYQQAVLIESEASYRNQFANNSAIMLLIDPANGAILDVNDSGLSFYGYPRERLLSMRIHDISTMDDAAIAEAIAHVVNNGGKRFTVQHRLADGTLRDVEVSLSAIRFGQRLILTSIIFDITTRKQAEDRFMAQQTQLADIINFLPDAALAINIDKQIIIWNHAIETMTGVPASQMLGKGDYACTIPFYGEARPHLMDLVFSDKEEISRRYPSITRHGDTLIAEVFCNALYDNKGAWVFAKASPLHDQAGNVIGAIEIVRDITERKLAEKELLFKNTILSTQLETSLDGILVVDENGTIISYNSRFVSMWGVPEEIVSTRDDARVLANVLTRVADAEVFFSRVNHLYVNRHETSREEVLLRDGRVFDRYSAPIVGSGETYYGRVWYFRDITERKQAETALRESEERHRTFLNATTDLVFLKDADLRYLLVNTHYKEFVGKAENEIVGKTDFDIFPAAMASRCHDSDHVAQKADDIVIHQETAGDRLYETKKFPVVLSGGEIGVGAFIRDITKQMQADQERAKLEEQLQQAMKMEAVGRLAGGVAHDFNNQLTAITGFVSLALLRLEPTNPLTEMLLQVKKSADSAAELTRQLLSFSRKQLIEPKLIDLTQILNSSHKMLVRLIGEDIELNTLPGENLGCVNVDPVQFEQILVNLAINARDAMPDGGKLVIETKAIVLDEEYCRSHPHTAPGDYVMLAISDTGCGMSDEVKSHLFEPFFTTKAKGRGTGLGLATIYGAVKQAGGSVDVYSEIGHGTTFKLYLPRVLGEAELIPGELAGQGFVGGPETILLVEDEEMVRNLASTILTSLGYRLLKAADGAQACALAEEFSGRIDLLLTDVVMPGMNGRQIAEHLLLTRPEIKILYTSGYTEDAIANHGIIDAGLNFIGKPYTPQGLAQKLREVLGKRSSG